MKYYTFSLNSKGKLYAHKKRKKFRKKAFLEEDIGIIQQMHAKRNYKKCEHCCINSKQ